MASSRIGAPGIEPAEVLRVREALRVAATTPRPVAVAARVESYDAERERCVVHGVAEGDPQGFSEGGAGAGAGAALAGGTDEEDAASAGDARLSVDTRLLGPFEHPPGTMVRIIGDLEATSVSATPILRAKVVTVADALDTVLYNQAITAMRAFLADIDAAVDSGGPPLPRRGALRRGTSDDRAGASSVDGAGSADRAAGDAVGARDDAVMDE